MVGPRLLRAYRETVYRVGGVAVRIGRRCPEMDRLLAMRGVRTAAFISADNPYSRRVPCGRNRRMRQALAQIVRRRAWVAASGVWRDWSETHLLLFGDVEPVCRWARRLRQHAIVVARLRQPARLVIIAR